MKKIIMTAKIEIEVDEEKIAEQREEKMELFDLFKDGAIVLGDVQVSILDVDGNDVVPQEQMRDARDVISKMLTGKA